MLRDAVPLLCRAATPNPNSEGVIRCRIGDEMKRSFISDGLVHGDTDEECDSKVDVW